MKGLQLLTEFLFKLAPCAQMGIVWCYCSAAFLQHISRLETFHTLLQYTMLYSSAVWLHQVGVCCLEDILLR